jgi:MarR family transcriptional regulator, organic hydroperoxide resistance regulator
MDLYPASVDSLEQLRYRVLAAQRDGNRTLASLLKPVGVTPAQAEVLRVLDDAREPLTISGLGERLVCEPGSPSRLVSSLVEAGLVARRAHRSDARASTLELTAHGREQARQIAAVEARFYDALRERLTSTDDDIEIALRVLREISGDGASATALRRRLAR